MPLPRDIANQGPRPLTIADEQEIGELQLAWGHAMWRNNLVAKVFCYLSVMRAAGLIPDKSKVLLSPHNLRVPQDFNASGGNQAAHYLPGFVAIASGSAKTPRYLWDLISDTAIRDKVAALFRATQDLPASFNRADSAAEARQLLAPAGLKQVFGEGCQLTLDQRPPKSIVTGEALIVVDRPLVIGVFRQWAQGSIAAYEHAATRKVASVSNKRPMDVKTQPHTDIAKGVLNEWTKQDITARVRDLGRTVHGRKGSVQEFTDQESFLRAYANVTNAEFPLHDAIIHEIEAPFSAHKMPSWFVSNAAT